jgi:hypothetical protein
MNWYVTRLLFRNISTLARGDAVTGGEDSFRLIRARNIKEARRKAVKLGKKSQYKYKNLKGRPVRVELVACLDVCRVEDGLKDGKEIYSLLLVPREIKSVHKMFELNGGKLWVRPE